MRYLVPALACAALATRTPAQLHPADPEFAAGSVRVDDAIYPYRLLRPEVGRRDELRPLVVFLHGAGERGSDNEKHLSWLPEVMARPELRQRWPSYLLAVQCPAGERWVDTDWANERSESMQARPTPAMRAVLLALDEVLASESVDPARVYLAGLSMGGYGAWDLATREPDRFAAVLTAAGGGDERQVGRLLGLPVCVYHGTADRVVPVARSRSMVDALRRIGGEVIYHELEGVGHDSWRQAFAVDGALPWLFAQDQRQQRRGTFATYAVVPSPDRIQLEGGRFTLAADARCVAVGDGAEAGTMVAQLVSQFSGRTLTAATEPAQPGDVEIRLDPDQADAIVVDVDAVLQISLRDRDMVARAAALLVQMIGTWPGASCPRGILAIRELPGGGCIRVGTGGGAWTAVELESLLRAAWLYGAATVVGSRFDDLDAFLGTEEATRLRGVASRLGIEFCDVDHALPAADFVVELDGAVTPASLLSQPCPVDARWSIACPAVAAGEQLEMLGVALPCVAERAMRPEAHVHVGGVLSRTGATLRAR
ncbi:MAG: dienelactone hydrolase family protein [Planctomycetes bacterium]|nr:dienelactone hydrolase family protein [Planctomycetota bacterium]